MDFLSGVQLTKVPGIVRDEGETFLDDPGHQVPVGFSAQSKPVYMKTLVTVGLRHGHERCVQALVDQKFHEMVPADLGLDPAFKGSVLVDFARKPCSDKVLGRPRAG